MKDKLKDVLEPNSDVAQMLVKLKKTKKEGIVNQLIHKDVSIHHSVVVLMETPQEVMLKDQDVHQFHVNILNTDVALMELPIKQIMTELTVQSTDVTK